MLPFANQILRCARNDAAPIYPHQRNAREGGRGLIRAGQVWIPCEGMTEKAAGASFIWLGPTDIF